MNNFIKYGAAVLLSVGMAACAVSCDDDDPKYVPVTPPQVAVAPHTLTGCVTTVNGTPVKGAQVVLSGAAELTAVTGNDGIYLFDNVKPGSYHIDVKAAGMLPQKGSITVAASALTQHLVWNTTLNAQVKVEVPVSQTQTVESEVTTEALPDNEKAEVKVETEVPAAAVAAAGDEDVRIIITPLYDADMAGQNNRATATEPVLAVGASLSCNKPGATLNKSVDLKFNLDDEAASAVKAMKYANGKWQTTDCRVENGAVIIAADEFADYGLFLDITFSHKMVGKPVTFTQSVWDNFYGKAPMKVDEAVYTFMSGATFDRQGTTVLKALLIEKLAARYGAQAVKMTGKYPLNVTLPIGTKMTVSGQQEEYDVVLSAAGSKVDAVNYGKVTMTVKTESREHTGGSN